MVTVSADPHTRLISIDDAPVGGLQSVDVRADVYSQLKDAWHSDAALQRLRFPFEIDGGRAVSPTEANGRYIFLANQDGWRVQPYDADAEVTLVGNLFPQDVTIPLYVSRPGRTIVVQVQRSAQALVELVTPGFTPADSTRVTTLLKYATNKLVIDGDASTLTLYDDDGTTPFQVWALQDRNGSPITLPSGVQARRLGPQL